MITHHSMILILIKSIIATKLYHWIMEFPKLDIQKTNSKSFKINQLKFSNHLNMNPDNNNLAQTVKKRTIHFINKIQFQQKKECKMRINRWLLQKALWTHHKLWFQNYIMKKNMINNCFNFKVYQTKRKLWLKREKT